MVEAAAILRRRWKGIVLGVVLVALLAGAASALWVEPDYESTASLIVQARPSGEGVAAGDLAANTSLLATYVEILQSRQIAGDVLARVGGGLSVEELLQKVRVRTAEESLVTAVTVRDGDPVRAQQLADGFAQSFLANLPKLMKVDNVAILDQASLPNQPVGPNIGLNVAVAAVLALLVGVGVAFLREFTDQTLKEEQEVAAVLGLPVLGVIDVVDMSKTRKGDEAR